MSFSEVMHKCIFMFLEACISGFRCLDSKMS